MVVKPAISFLARDPDAVLIKDTGIILTSVTGNENYPAPTPALALIKTALDEFVAAVQAAAGKDRMKIAIKNAKRAVLVSLLRQLASYVAGQCAGDMTKLISSGFPVQKPNRQPIGQMQTPRTPQVRRGPLTGEATAVTDRQTGAYIYNWRVALASAPETYVRTVQSTAARVVFSGLTPGAIYLFQVNAVGAAGPSNWSNAASLMVV